MKRALQAVLCIAMISLFACIHASPKPEISVVDAVFTDVTLLETGLEFTLRLTNNTPEPMSIEGATYHFSLDGDDIGSGSNGDAVTIPRFGSVTQKVRVGLSNLAMLSQIRTLVESKRFNYKVESDFYFKGSGPFRSERRVTKQGELDVSGFGDDAQFEQ
ncbi:MAG: LEA type 2 family protein [Bdellovibrionota bacterium]